MTNIQGVSVHKADGYSVFWLSELSEGLKCAIRSRLSAVCHGAANAESGSEMYCYKSTLKEFLKRYSSKSERQKRVCWENYYYIFFFRHFMKNTK